MGLGFTAAFLSLLPLRPPTVVTLRIYNRRHGAESVFICDLFKYIYNSRDYIGLQTAVRELYAARGEEILVNSVLPLERMKQNIIVVRIRLYLNTYSIRSASVCDPSCCDVRYFWPPL